ncbi:MAG: ATP-binding cassette domain-containing protein [Verrucomicrobiota bacterium]
MLGRNRSGKTTTIKMLAGSIWPDAGEIRVDGVEPARFSVEGRWRIGCVSGRFYFRVSRLRAWWIFMTSRS